MKQAPDQQNISRSLTLSRWVSILNSMLDWFSLTELSFTEINRFTADILKAESRN